MAVEHIPRLIAQACPDMRHVGSYHINFPHSNTEYILKFSVVQYFH
jgi:hypothetical protein